MVPDDDKAIDIRVVSIVNDSMPAGQVANALIHMGAGLCNLLSEVQRDALKFISFEDAGGVVYPSISARSFIVLKGRSIDIARLREAAANLKIPHVCFLKSMTGGTYLTQIANTRSIQTDEVEFVGATIYGRKEELRALTRKFSLL